MAALPTGVEIRNGKICIWFIYRGKRCREVLNGWVNNSANIKKAGNLRAVITGEITLGEFDYAIRFPNSSAANKFDTTQRIITWGELSDSWLMLAEIELAANTLRKTRSQLKSITFFVGKDTPLSSIQHNDILAYRKELLQGTTFYSEKNAVTKKGAACGQSITISRCCVRSCDMAIAATT